MNGGLYENLRIVLDESTLKYFPQKICCGLCKTVYGERMHRVSCGRHKKLSISNSSREYYLNYESIICMIYRGEGGLLA